MANKHKKSVIERIADNPKLSKKILETGSKMFNRMIAKYSITDIRWGVDGNSPDDSVVIKITCKKPEQMITDINNFSIEIQKTIEEKRKSGELN